MEKSLKNVLKNIFFNHYSYVLIIEKLPLLKIENIENDNIIYMLDESHILPLSWQCLNIKNKKYILKPLLVPGLKAYHFSLDINNEYNIHETTILNNQLSSIPLNSIVLLVCGEIDCRLN